MSRIDANRVILVKLLVVTIGMFGFGYALVPLYEKICEVTGINEVEKANAPLANTQIDAGRLVTLEFDANVRSDLPWTFRPMQVSLKVHPGQLVQVKYEGAMLRIVRLPDRLSRAMDRRLQGSISANWSAFASRSRILHQEKCGRCRWCS